MYSRSLRHQPMQPAVLISTCRCLQSSAQSAPLVRFDSKLDGLIALAANELASEPSTRAPDQSLVACSPKPLGVDACCRKGRRHIRRQQNTASSWDCCVQDLPASLGYIRPYHTHASPMPAHALCTCTGSQKHYISARWIGTRLCTPMAQTPDAPRAVSALLRRPQPGMHRISSADVHRQDRNQGRR
ncbi:hypothetical protein F5Y18DRAFT_30363 [Xylariaceae sp. FL1019]|nr:hypothetical protein F5Y18DRAFT_30363 [Xylariaceae sp. FL1019]